MLGLGVRLVARGALWATRLFYELGRDGPALPDGPVLVVANHPNSLVDALVVFCVAGRPVHPLARAPLFERPVIGQVLHELGGLPVYRPQDDPALLGRNDATFDAAVAALGQGEAVLVFPEGTSHSQPELAPLKTGAARIALRAEAEAQWQLGLRIVPIGLTYRRKAFFRGEAAASVGAALETGAWREAHARDAVAAVRSLTAAIAEALEAVTLQLQGPEDEVLLHAAEALYVAERGLEAPGERDALATRLPRLQVFAAGMNWLRAQDPARFARLAGAVRSHAARLSRLGIEDGELPKAQTWWVTLRALGRDGLLAVLGLPLAALGVVAWYLPYVAPRAVLRLHRPAYEAIATVKLVTALAAFPLVYAVWLALVVRARGGLALAVAAILLPIAGLVTLYWREHYEDLRADLRAFALSLRRRGLAEQLRERQRALVDEMDRVVEDWEAEKGGRPETSAAT